MGQVFALSLLSLAGTLALLFFFVFRSSRDAAIESSERYRDQASREISESVTRFLNGAPAALGQLKQEIGQGLVDGHDPAAMETALYGILLSNQDLGELAFTFGEQTGYGEDGSIELAEKPRGQLTVVRSGDSTAEPQIWSRYVHQEGGGWVADRRTPGNHVALALLAWTRETGRPVEDPTQHPTFVTPARRNFSGRLLWSDLHWSQLDADLPPEKRRVEVSVQQAVMDASGKFLGVMRVGLLAETLDRAARTMLADARQHDPHRIFICDTDGRLITRLSPSDPIVEMDDDLRIAPVRLPPEVGRALQDPLLRTASETSAGVSSQFRLGGEDFLTTFRPLNTDWPWVVGIVVPRTFYLGRLVALRNQLLTVSLAVMILLVLGGGLILRGVKRAQSQIARESLRMNAFEFSPAPTASAFRDVSIVLEGLEKAKNAMRAMGKYVPMELVRRLYREKSEPTLGGEPTEVSIMFTDIQDFTTLSERLEPNQLAAALGRYLEEMSRIIQHETGGTIDKFIGDAIMTFWNAPEPVPEHARMACLAALRCRVAGEALAQAPDWAGWPPFTTRFGLHHGTALIGHFGAPDRLNYTAIGDAINLASRLEGLNKQYGTTIIASETIVREAGDDFDFRLLDLVAVKGKSKAIRIYELLGEKGASEALTSVVKGYEKAFAAYLARDFSAAISVLETLPADEPSAVLLVRCRAYLETPPPEDWNGIYVAQSK